MDSKNNVPEKITFKLPKDRETYIQKLILLIFLTILVLYVLIKNWEDTFFHKFIFYFFIFISIIVLSDKIAQLFKINLIELTNTELITKKNDIIVSLTNINNLAIKVNIGTDNLIERTFYNLEKNEKIFTYKDKDMGEKESKEFLSKLSLLLKCDYDFMSKSTFGSLVPLSITNDTEKSIDLTS